MCRCESDHGLVWLIIDIALCSVCEYIGESHDHGQDDCECGVCRSLLKDFLTSFEYW